MRARVIDVRHSVGRVLLTSIFNGGKKLLSKGHRIQDNDVQLLESQALRDVWVAELEEGDVGEDDAAMLLASHIGNGALEARPAVGGRANLFTTQACCVLVDSELLKQTNATNALVIATSRNFSYARLGQRVSTIKSAPFAVTKSQLESLLLLLAQKGPILQARPILTPVVAVLYTDAVSGERASRLFGTIMSQRLERLGTVTGPVLNSIEDEMTVADALERLLKSKPTVILIGSTTSPAGPYDSVGRAMERVGCHIERFLAPVEPGSLLLLGYKNEVPILSAPGCFRSAKPNVLDLVLPPMLARYRLSTWDIASLGQGGLLD
jgi:molybdenum cofactor cytidylyltransferase